MNKDITNYSFLEKLAQDLVIARKNNYSEDCIGFIIINAGYYFQ